MYTRGTQNTGRVLRGGAEGCNLLPLGSPQEAVAVGEAQERRHHVSVLPESRDKDRGGYLHVLAHTVDDAEGRNLWGLGLRA